MVEHYAKQVNQSDELLDQVLEDDRAAALQEFLERDQIATDGRAVNNSNSAQRGA
jgi:hypothetical protein